jgi:hypothetical protein
VSQSRKFGWFVESVEANEKDRKKLEKETKEGVKP